MKGRALSHSTCKLFGAPMNIALGVVLFLQPITADRALSAQAPRKSSSKGASRQSRIRISPETTRLTEPLDEEGYVRYVAAFNARKSEGVTPESNAAVLVWKALGPEFIPEEERPWFWRAIGMAPMPERGDYFQADLSEEDDGDELDYAFADQVVWATSVPWSETDFPDVARWLSVNEKPLALISKACQRPHYFSPRWTTRTDDNWEAMIGLALADLQELRTVARALVARSMFRLKKGQIEEARQDLLDCHRLGVLLSRDGCLIAQLVGISLNGLACSAEQVLAQQGNLTAEQSQRFERDLQDLRPLPQVFEALEEFERWTMMDMLCASARKGIEGATQGKAAGGWTDPALAVIEATIDWNAVLKFANGWYDRAAAIARITDLKERQTAADLFHNDIMALKQELPAGGFGGITNLGKQTTEGVAKIFVTLLFPAFDQAMIARDRAQVRLDTTRIAFQLARFRREHGQYPDDLKELAAGNDSIPLDLYSGRDLIYRRVGERGYSLYSVGQNGIDDGGATFDSEPAGDDIRAYDSGEPTSPEALKKGGRKSRPKFGRKGGSPQLEPLRYDGTPPSTFSLGAILSVCIALVLVLSFSAWFVKRRRSPLPSTEESPFLE